MRSQVARLALAVVGISLLTPTSAEVSVAVGNVGDRCQFPDGAVGRCEHSTICLADEGVLKRNGNIVLCMGVSNPLDLVTCCRRPHRVADEICSGWAQYWLMRGPDDNKICTSSKPLIHGGEESRLGEFPHMAALGLYREDDSPSWFCGGSLITPSFVLTAAHCLRGLKNGELFVSLGDHDLSSRAMETTPRLNGRMPEGLAMADTADEDSDFAYVEQRINVSEVILHPEYQRRYHDIALLRLQQPAVLTRRVLPACLPTRVAGHYSPNSVFTVSGWGDLAQNTPLVDPQGSRKLQKVNIGHIESTLCSHSFTDLPLGITTDIICAASPGKDSCSGDSGGPLMQRAPLNSNDELCHPQMVVGIVSFGTFCGGTGAYTRVESYIDWITGIVAPGVLFEQVK